MTAKQIAALKKQLKVANARLLSIEREGQKLKDDIAALAALLKRVEPGLRTP
jgi:cell division FtsZ-interacting protein ZapD